MLLSYNIDVPYAVSSLALMEDGVLLVGCADGTVRMYVQSSTKVARAVKSLGAEISSICCSKPGGRQLTNWWCASGTRVLSFPSRIDKMILSAHDASASFALGEGEEDVLNEVGIDLSHDGKHLAYSTDNGTVGVVDLSTGYVSRMRTRHTSICGSVKFIPDRPSELVSAGYDCKLLHHDFQQRTLISELDLAQLSPSGNSEVPGMQLSPPFVLSTTIANTGIFAATTANGIAFVGVGGEKCPLGPAKKKRRRWEGLNEGEGQVIKVAEGPVAAAVFLDQHQFVTCTLLGELRQFTINHNHPRGEHSLLFSCHEQWTGHTQKIAKVNAIVIAGRRMAIGGLAGDGRGVVEIWDTSRGDR